MGRVSQGEAPLLCWLRGEKESKEAGAAGRSDRQVRLFRWREFVRKKVHHIELAERTGLVFQEE